MDLLTTTIDLDAIAHNARLIKQRVAPAQLMAVVKADGYNHGAAEVAQVMAANGADRFGVATIAEAMQLRDAGIEQPILAWIWSLEQDYQSAIDRGISLAIHNLGDARVLAQLDCEVAVMVDTGLRRSGLPEEDWQECFNLLAGSSARVSGVFSHLASADVIGDPTTDWQAENFRRAVKLARESGLDVPMNHLANSPAALSRTDLHWESVRPGLICYGLEPIVGHEHGLRPALSWSARVTVVKKIAAGEGTSYNHTWRAPHGGNYAIVPVGYADGLPRAVQGHLEVGIGGKRYPQVGRVCMDQIVVWLDQDVVDLGERAVIFGEGGMSATELAEAVGTINYEVVCWPKGRTVREYVGGEQ